MKRILLVVCMVLLSGCEMNDVQKRMVGLPMESIQESDNSSIIPLTAQEMQDYGVEVVLASNQQGSYKAAGAPIIVTYILIRVGPTVLRLSSKYWRLTVAHLSKNGWHQDLQRLILKNGQWVVDKAFRVHLPVGRASSGNYALDIKAFLAYFGL